MKKISVIAKSLEFKDWNKIRRKFSNQFPSFSTLEKEIFVKYKNYQNTSISFNFLKNAEFLLIDKKRKIQPKSIFLKKVRTRGKDRILVLVNNEYKSYPAYINAYFKCWECTDIFKVECNFAKWIKYFHGPVCKNCKKKLVTKTESYKKTYKDSMMKRYGVNFPIQNKEINRKIRNTMLERYGVEYSAESPELLQKTWTNTIWKHKASSLEEEFARSILENVSQDALTCLSKNRPKIKIKFRVWQYPDIMIGNKLIEFYGDFWHGNPRLYEENYLLPRKITVKQKWKQDEKRIKEFKKKGYDVMVVWEQDWNDNSKKVLQEVREFINGG